MYPTVIGVAKKHDCGAPNKTGGDCRFPEISCPHHQGWQKQPTLEGAISGRDLHMLAWWMIQDVASETLEPKRASVINQAARLLILLGKEGEDEEEMLARIVLRGRLMQGLPPATPEQWELTEAMYTDDALEEIRRWPPLLERDAADARQPLQLRKRGAGEHQLSGAGQIDNGIAGDFVEGLAHEAGPLAADLLPLDRDDAGVFGIDEGGQFPD